MSSILVVAAHPDDEILGCGGTVKKHFNNGDNVHCVILGEGMTSRVQSRNLVHKEILDDLKECTLNASQIIGYKNTEFFNLPDNRFDSVDLLDIIKIIDKVVSEIKPEIIYTHHYGDLNIDHRRTFDAVLTACRPLADSSVKEIYCFETPSSTEWSFNSSENIFKPNVFIDIEATIDCKLAAMECYKTELRDYPHPRSLDALKIIASRWGTVISKKYVEAFELIRKVE